MFTADNLRFFLVLARTGRLVDSAKLLGVDHTTVGRRVTMLEKSAGQRLFDRLPSGWKLTAAGHRLVPYAETIQAALIAAQESQKPSDRGLTGTVRIMATDGFGTFVLAPQLGRLHARHPDLDIDLVISSDPISLASGCYDVAVTSEPPPLRGVVAKELAIYTMRFYASRSYIRSHGSVRTVDDLREHHLVWHLDTLLCASPPALVDATVAGRRAQVQTNSVTGHWQSARGGVGIALLPTYVGDTDDTLTPILPASVAFRRTYWMVTPKELASAPRLRAVGNSLSDIVQSHCALDSPEGSST